jgi:hypothetical protein
MGRKMQIGKVAHFTRHCAYKANAQRPKLQ